jgi:ferredoxin-NADP reductase
MAKTLHPISVLCWEETRSVVTFAFELEHGLEYQAGQYVTLKLAGVKDPRGSQRPFTLSSSPTEGARLSITTKMSDSPFKARLTEISERGALDEIKMRGPMGEFKFTTARAAVMVAGGIGITPFRSMLRMAGHSHNDSSKHTHGYVIHPWKAWCCLWLGFWLSAT